MNHKCLNLLIFFAFFDFFFDLLEFSIYVIVVFANFKFCQNR